MNTILRKCLEELSKPECDNGYIRGMLETLLEMNRPLMMGGGVVGGLPLPHDKPLFTSTQAGIPAPGNLEEIKKMSGL